MNSFEEKLVSPECYEADVTTYVRMDSLDRMSDEGLIELIRCALSIAAMRATGSESFLSMEGFTHGHLRVLELLKESLST